MIKGTYNVVPFTATLWIGPVARPIGCVAAPYWPNQTMTSYVAPVVLELRALVAPKNISRQTLAFKPPADSSAEVETV